MRVARHIATAMAVAGTVAFTAPAQAQTLISGTATGCFYGSNNGTTSCTPGTSSTSTSTMGGATYTGSTFRGNTFGTPNRVSFGGNPMTPNVNNFGSVALTGAATSYNNQFFNLMLSFTNPSVANTTFFANLTGQVGGVNRGSLSFMFTNPDQTFAYDGGRSFTVHVNDLDVNPGLTTSITGNVTSTVPEPSSMALLGTGLIGLVPMIRRRKNRA